MPGRLRSKHLLPWHFNDASICAPGGLWKTLEFMNRLLIVGDLGPARHRFIACDWPTLWSGHFGRLSRG
jgi:hypothetical protein